MRIVVTGLIATYPLGGVAWDYVAYVAGFARLGHEVFYLEDTGGWLYDPRAQTFTDDVTWNIQYLVDAFTYAGVDLGGRWSVRSPDGAHHGATLEETTRFCRRADLFLNVSGACWLRDEYRGARCNAYLDSDPGYSQAKLDAVARGTASEDVAYSVNLIHSHDRFFTFAENINDPSCAIPHCDLDWIPTRQPIVLEHWPYTYRPDAPAYTTVMSWKTDVTLPAIDGVTYGGKDLELPRFIDVPQRTTATLELAVAGNAPLDLLAARGWHIANPQEKSGTMAAYRDYLLQSRGEWSVAKQAYVALRSGWFSTRSAAYLACGKPAVLQDTGFSQHYETGAGVFAFTTATQAADALAAIEADYRHHCEAARAFAEREFTAERVLGKLLADAGLVPP
jgi:hypothetical protein